MKRQSILKVHIRFHQIDMFLKFVMVPPSKRSAPLLTNPAATSSQPLCAAPRWPIRGCVESTGTAGCAPVATFRWRRRRCGRGHRGDDRKRSCRYQRWHRERRCGALLCLQLDLVGLPRFARAHLGRWPAGGEARALRLSGAFIISSGGEALPPRIPPAGRPLAGGKS